MSEPDRILAGSRLRCWTTCWSSPLDTVEESCGSGNGLCCGMGSHEGTNPSTAKSWKFGHSECAVLTRSSDSQRWRHRHSRRNVGGTVDSFGAGGAITYVRTF